MAQLITFFRANGFRKQRALELERQCLPIRYRKRPEYIPLPLGINRMVIGGGTLWRRRPYILARAGFRASAGAMIMLIPLMLTSIRSKPAWKDTLRMSILVTWILAYIATPVEGFFIEFNEATMSGGATDVVFGNQQYFALFGITMVTIAFLAVDFYQDRRGSRSMVATLGMLVTIFTVIAGYIYAYVDPGVVNADGTLAGTTTWGWIYAGGLLLVSLVIIAAMVAVLRGAEEPIAPVMPAAPPKT